LAFLNDTAATIIWETNEDSDSLVRYGETQAYGNEEYDPLLTPVHSININDLIPDTLYHFQVESTDLFGNPNASMDFNFTTPDTTSPIVWDPEIIDLQETQATIYWETNEESDSLVRYGLTLGYELGEIIDENLTLYHTITITGLTKLVTYHFQVESADRHGNNETSLDFYFTTPDTTAPIITAGPFVTSTTANGATIEWSTDEPSTTIVEYWITEQGIPYIESDFTLTESHIMTLEGLQEDTLYSFKIKSADESGNEYIGNEMSFPTPDETPPQITFGPVVHDVNDTAARITWKTDEHSNSIVKYGPTTSYGNTSSSSSYLKNHEVYLRDLSPLTLYHFQVISYDKAGNQVKSSDLNFTTDPPIDRTPPKIIDGPEITKHEDTTIVIYWTTDEPSDGVVEFGTTTDYDFIEIDSEFSQSHSIWLTDLSPSTTYHYRIISKDEVGNEFVSSDFTVTTKESFPDLNINVKNLGDYDEVHGTIVVEGEVSGTVGDVDYIRIKIDNESWQEVEPDNSFNFEIDTGGLTEGTHTLVIMVGDDNERVATTAVILIVKKPEEKSQDIWPMLLLLIAIAIIAITLIAYILIRNRNRKSLRGFGYGPGAMALQSPPTMFVPEGGPYPNASFAPIEILRCPKCNAEFEAEITGETIICPSCYYAATT
jgi:chitodextrinase